MGSVFCRLAVHGVLAGTLLLGGAQPGSAGLQHRHDPIQCCHAGASGAPKCRVKSPRACRKNGDIDMGPGTCNPNPCGAAATLPIATTTTTSTTSTTVPPCGTFLLKWGVPSRPYWDLIFPKGVATDGSGNVYVADTYTRRIQKFDTSGSFLTAWGSEGSGNGQFGGPVGPFGVAADGSGNVYVADTYNTRIQKFDANGTFLTT